MKFEFTPPKGSAIHRRKRLEMKRNIIEDLDVERKKDPAYDEIMVTFPELDKGDERTGVHKVPVRFFMRPRNAYSSAPKDEVVIKTMTMQESGGGVGFVVRKRNLGPEGRKVYHELQGYPLALASLAAVLHGRGVRTIWLPSGDAVDRYKGVVGMKAHLKEKIYDGTARRLGYLDAVSGKDILYPSEKYYKIPTADFAHLKEYLKPI